MAVTYEQAQMVINMIGLMEGEIWYVLDNVILVTYSGTSYSFLDAFLIAGVVVDMAWEILDEMRP